MVLRILTCVTLVGISDEMWWFSTSALGWQRVDNTVTNGAGPARAYHVMTSVGMDLWVHGGLDSGEGDACVTRATQQQLLW